MRHITVASLVLILFATPLVAQSKKPADLALGKVVVATRDIGDHSFAETVILLVQFNMADVTGLVLNRVSTVPLAHGFPSLKAAQQRTDHFYAGGPVEQDLVFGLLKSDGLPRPATPVMAGVFLITDRDLLDKTLDAKPAPDMLHLYLGYTGWSYAQLVNEVTRGQWYIFPGTADMIYDPNPELLWTSLINKADPQPHGRAGAALFLPPHAQLRTESR